MIKESIDMYKQMIKYNRRELFNMLIDSDITMRTLAIKCIEEDIRQYMKENPDKSFDDYKILLLSDSISKLEAEFIVENADDNDIKEDIIFNINEFSNKWFNQ